MSEIKAFFSSFLNFSYFRWIEKESCERLRSGSHGYWDLHIKRQERFFSCYYLFILLSSSPFPPPPPPLPHSPPLLLLFLLFTNMHKAIIYGNGVGTQSLSCQRLIKNNQALQILYICVGFFSPLCSMFCVYMNFENRERQNKKINKFGALLEYYILLT